MSLRSRMCGTAALVALAIATAGAAVAVAQERTTVVRVLRESRDFRARTRAALALGGSADPAMALPLVGALSDSEPAVRAAAAAGLGRLGNTAAIPALERAMRDSSPEVRDAVSRSLRSLRASAPPPAAPAPSARAHRYPAIEVMPRAREHDWGRVQYVVVLGSMEDRSGFTHHDRLGSMMRTQVQRHLSALRGVATLEDGSRDEEAARQISRRRLPQLRLEGSVVRIHPEARGRDLSVRCEISLMLMDEPGHNLRAALSGAATGSEAATHAARSAQERALAERALEGAVRSAMSGAIRAITASGH